MKTIKHWLHFYSPFFPATSGTPSVGTLMLTSGKCEPWRTRSKIDSKFCLFLLFGIDLSDKKFRRGVYYFWKSSVYFNWLLWQFSWIFQPLVVNFLSQISDQVECRLRVGLSNCRVTVNPGQIRQITDSVVDLLTSTCQYVLLRLKVGILI